MTMTNMMDGKCQSLQLLLGSAPNGTWAMAGIMAETLPKSSTTTGMQAHSDNLQGKNQLNCNSALQKSVKQPTC